MMYFHLSLSLSLSLSALGEATPGASVQKPAGVAASKQDIYAGMYHMIIT